MYGKKYVAFGDSITEGTGTTTWTSYADLIAAANSMPLTMKAAGGTVASQMYTAMSKSSDILAALTEEDFVIIGGFVNDAKGTPIGTITPAGSTEFDASTFIGVLEQMFYDYTNNVDYKAKIGVVLTSEPKDYRAKPEYWEAAISVLEKYNIPYLNLYEETFELADIVHPTLEGQRQMAAIVEEWMNTLP